MSRSGYSDDGENLELWRANLERTLAGKKGQQFLRELGHFMDAMPVKELIADKLIDEKGQCCTMGVVVKARNLDASKIDYKIPSQVGKALGISSMMAQEIAFMNDEFHRHRYVNGKYLDETPAQRWRRMRQWVRENTLPTTA